MSKPLTDEKGEVRELTAEDFKHFQPFSSLPEEKQEGLFSLRKHGNARSSATLNQKKS